MVNGGMTIGIKTHKYCISRIQISNDITYCILHYDILHIAMIAAVLGDIRKTRKTEEGNYEIKPQVAKRQCQKRKNC